MAVALAGVELTRIRDDPYVHFGDLLQVVHASTGASLANDVEDKVCARRIYVHGLAQLSLHHSVVASVQHRHPLS
jgi:hypothetical protein